MHLRGVGFEDIARHLGMRRYQDAWQRYRTALRRIPQKAAAEARAAQIERLDRLRSKVWSHFKDATDATDLATLAVAALRIEAREASLLGLDAPRQLEVAQVQDDDLQERRQRQQEVLAKLSIPARAELLELMRRQKGDNGAAAPNPSGTGSNGKP
jgi:hypothetical protein